MGWALTTLPRGFEIVQSDRVSLHRYVPTSRWVTRILAGLQARRVSRDRDPPGDHAHPLETLGHQLQVGFPPLHTHGTGGYTCMVLVVPS